MLTIGVANAGSSGPKVVILELHGMKQGIIDESLEGLPHFQELIRGPRNAQAYVYLPQVFVTIPAASVPGISSMYTGLYPQRTGVVSTIWFGRRTTKVRTMVSYFQQRINRILTSNGVKSLFDYVGESGRHSMTTMLMLTKGADWSVKSGAFFGGMPLCWAFSVTDDGSRTAPMSIKRPSALFSPAMYYHMIRVCQASNSIRA
jgi:hypothetical protein